VAACRLAYPRHETKFDLEGTSVWVASVGRLEDGSGVAAPGHKELGGMVDLGELSANDSAVASRDMVDDAVDESQIERGSANGADKKMPVTTASDI